MHYVYIIQSESHPGQRYIGYSAFPNKQTALDFESYLKSHSGKAFAAKRLLP